jgi:flagellar secretion chaperone FliS
VAVLDEIHGLMREIRDAWEGVPSLVPATNRPASMMN